MKKKILVLTCIHTEKKNSLQPSFVSLEKKEDTEEKKTSCLALTRILINTPSSLHQRIHRFSVPVLLFPVFRMSAPKTPAIKPVVKKDGAASKPSVAAAAATPSAGVGGSGGASGGASTPNPVAAKKPTAAAPAASASATAPKKPATQKNTVAAPAAAAASVITAPTVAPTASAAGSHAPPLDVASGSASTIAKASMLSPEEERIDFARKKFILDEVCPQFGKVIGAEKVNDMTAVNHTVAMIVRIFFENEEGVQHDRLWEMFTRIIPIKTYLPNEKISNFKHLGYMCVPAVGTYLPDVGQPQKIGGCKFKLVHIKPVDGKIPGFVRGVLLAQGNSNSSIGNLARAPLRPVPFTYAEIEGKASLPVAYFSQIQNDMIGTSVLYSHGCRQEDYIYTPDHKAVQLVDATMACLDDLWSSNPERFFYFDWAHIARHNFRSADGLSVRPDGALFYEFELNAKLKDFLKQKQHLNALARTNATDASGAPVNPNSIFLHDAFNFFTDLPSLEETEAKRDELAQKPWNDKDGIERIQTLQLSTEVVASLRDFVYMQKKLHNPDEVDPRIKKTHAKKKGRPADKGDHDADGDATMKDATNEDENEDGSAAASSSSSSAAAAAAAAAAPTANGDAPTAPRKAGRPRTRPLTDAPQPRKRKAASESGGAAAGASSSAGHTDDAQQVMVIRRRTNSVSADDFARIGLALPGSTNLAAFPDVCRVLFTTMFDAYTAAVERGVAAARAAAEDEEPQGRRRKATQNKRGGKRGGKKAAGGASTTAGDADAPDDAQNGADDTNGDATADANGDTTADVTADATADATGDAPADATEDATADADKEADGDASGNAEVDVE
jgi:hypothetical protein